MEVAGASFALSMVMYHFCQLWFGDMSARPGGGRGLDVSVEGESMKINTCRGWGE